MYTLFLSQNTYAMSAHALLEELDVPYELHPVEIFTPEPDPAFLAASPHARVPALAFDGGSLCESGAIALHLTDRHPDKGLGIPPEDPRRGTYLQWMFYLSSTLQPDVMLQFHPEFYFADPDRKQALMAASMKRLAGVWSVLEAQLEEGPFLFGAQPCAFDFCLGMQIIWPECFADGIQAHPRLARLLDALTTRPAVQRILPWHGY